VGAAGGDVEAIVEAIWTWAVEHRLADGDGLIVTAACLTIGSEPEPVLSAAVPVKFAPVPAPIEIRLRIGLPLFGDSETELRRLLVDEAERAIDEALAELRRRADEGGLAAEPERRNEREHAQWTVRHLVGRETIAAIAERAGVDERSVRRSISALRRRAGLPVRRKTRNQA
jgi:hypothetical protein